VKENLGSTHTPSQAPSILSRECMYISRDRKLKNTFRYQ